MDEYTANNHSRTMRFRCLRLMRSVRVSRWTTQGCDPRNTAVDWYWRAVGALNYRKPAPL